MASILDMIEDDYKKQEQPRQKNEVIIMRVRHHLMSRGEYGASMRVLLNRMRFKDDKVLLNCLEWLITNKHVSITKSSRIYNGAPVHVYKWIGK